MGRVMYGLDPGHMMILGMSFSHAHQLFPYLKWVYPHIHSQFEHITAGIHCTCIHPGSAAVSLVARQL